MKNWKSKKRKALGLTAVIAIGTLLLSTFAWDVYQASKENKFGNAIVGGSIEVVEDFPDPHLDQGKELKKEVGITNTSSSTVLVRASFEESFKKLKDNADVTSYTDSELAAATYLPTANTKAIPVILDANYYTTAAAANAGDEFVDYKDITAKIDWGSGIGVNAPADVTVIAKSVKQSITNAAGDTEWRVTTTYVAYRKFALANSNLGEVSRNIVVKYPGDANSVALQVSGDLSPDFNVTTGAVTKYDFTNVKFDFYAGLSDPASLANWAGDDLHTTGTAVTPADHTKSAADALIHLNYDNLTATPTANNWFYNKEDGYFYYMAQLASGATTGIFLKSVQLDATAGSDYNYTDYSLWIDGEGILPKLAALDSEWSISSTSTGDSLAIYNFINTNGLAN